MIGTTISPYMQFFLQSQVVEKGSRTEDLTFTPRVDVTNGSILAIALAGFMIIANAATILHFAFFNEHGAKEHQYLPERPWILPWRSNRSPATRRLR